MKQETRKGAAVQLSDEAITHLILNTGLEREIILEWHRNFIVNFFFFLTTIKKFSLNLVSLK